MTAHTTTQTHRYCTIMCGGAGTRFWPFSTQDRPKQFLDFLGTGRSLLQLTVDRILPLVPAENIILVTNRAYVPLIREQLPQIPEANILPEPARRNTAPAILWATHHIMARDPQASIVTLPSDHLILLPDAFRRAIAEGLDFVEHNRALLTLGIRPTRPETGYGYIQQGTPHPDATAVYKVKCFTEKPSAEMARTLLQSGDFLWNAGIFLWSGATVLEAFAAHAPELAECFDRGRGVYGTPGEGEFIADAFPCATSISVDYAIMEKASGVYTLPVEMGWSDLGTWDALHSIADKDTDGNATHGCTLVQKDCSGSLFATDTPGAVIAIGLHDYVVARSGGGLLIAPRTAEATLRTLINDLRRQDPSFT